MIEMESLTPKATTTDAEIAADRAAMTENAAELRLEAYASARYAGASISDALDESIAEENDLDAWLGRGWPGVFVVKPTLLVNPPRAMARLAKAGASVVFSSALETAIGFRQGLHWAFAWPGEARAVGFGVGSLFAGSAGAVPPLVPFWRWADVERMNPEEAWNALR